MFNNLENNNQRPAFGDILKREYSRKQSWAEFKMMLRHSRTAMPLFTR